LRIQESEARLEAATRNCDWLRRELDRRPEIIEELKQKVVDLTHHVAETKAEAEKEMQAIKSTHHAIWLSQPPIRTCTNSFESAAIAERISEVSGEE
jgi:predicted  nucleic acid-binding Zn-ribbon protein